MNNPTKVLLAAAFAATMSGTALAGTAHLCAYVNDNVNGPNFVEGYKVGPGTTIAHVGPYSTNGSGNAYGTNAGGLGATRDRPRLKISDLYVDDPYSENITHFIINKTDCTLTLDTTLYPSGETGNASSSDPLAIIPDGRTMFVGSGGIGTIYSHTIAANGSLGPTFTEAGNDDFPNFLEVSPDGKTLVVTFDQVQTGVCAYPISGGHLGTPNCATNLTGNPTGGVAIDPGSTCVYSAESGRGSVVDAFTLTGSVLGPGTAYSNFGPAGNLSGILVNWDNKAIYVNNFDTAQVATGSIAPGCKLTYKTSIPDGVAGLDQPGQIAQGKIAHGYVVTGDITFDGTPFMGIFRAKANGNLHPVGTGQFPLMSGASPATVVVVGVK
jgi:hypothetical protein